MALTGSITIQGSVSGANSGSKTIGPVTITPTTPIIPTTVADLLVTEVAVAVPALANGVMVVFPAANTQTVTYRSQTGSGGNRVSKTQPFVMCFDAAAIPASIYFICGGTVAGVEFCWF